MKQLWSVFTAFYLTNAVAFCATIRVPADYPKIQEAINAAHANDEVVVSPGTYDEYVSIGKEITVRSTFDGKDWSLIENTRIINQVVVTSGTILRGLRIGYEGLDVIPNRNIESLGIMGDGTNATIEYCIIENCCYHLIKYGKGFGAAIIGVNGVIQNNIIRNNYADMYGSLYDCSGVIKNNLIYDNKGFGVGIDGHGIFLHNTISSSTHITFGFGSYTIANNIFWETGPGNPDIGIVPTCVPRNCLIKGYSGHGTGIITSDPEFVDPSTGDFHLQASSPCIDAGLTTGSIKADIIGVQRGLKGVSETRGDGSGVDIGAYEYKPKPVSVWLPNGGPDAINAGDTLTVAWELDVPPAGTAINLQLYNGSSRIADFGNFWNAHGAAESTIVLPTDIPTRATYTLRGISAWNPSLYFTAPLMTIFGKNAIPHIIWNEYP